jgi:ribonuclease D
MQMEDLAKIRGIEERLLSKHGEALLKVIADAKATDPATWPTRSKSQRLTAEQDAVVDLLLAVLRLRGNEHDVSPSLLASRKQLEALVLGDEESPVLHGWRAGLAGRDLQAVLCGEKSVRVVKGQMVVG